MDRRAFIGVVGGSLLAIRFAAEGQQAGKVPRVGYLVMSPLADPPSAERAAFLDGLRELGYVAGQNIIQEYRSAAWNRELLPDLAAELVDLKVNVIVAIPGAVEAARDATQSIPIVVPAFLDPVEEGFVASLARPEVNLEGREGWRSTHRTPHEVRAGHQSQDSPGTGVDNSAICPCPR